LEINGEKITLPKDASEQQIKELIASIDQPEAGDEATQPGTPRSEPTEPSRKPVADPLSRRLVLGDEVTVSKLPSGLGGIALGSSSEFYTAARSRITLAFRLSVGLALALAVILFGGIAATIVSGLMGHAAWSAAFGGVSVASLLGAIAYKPLTAISEAAVASQRLEIIHARLANQLMVCTEQPDIEKRIRCQTAVWNAIQKEISAMSSHLKAY
jgi:hypothetical protein